MKADGRNDAGQGNVNILHHIEIVDYCDVTSSYLYGKGVSSCSHLCQTSEAKNSNSNRGY